MHMDTLVLKKKQQILSSKKPKLIENDGIRISW